MSLFGYNDYFALIFSIYLVILCAKRFNVKCELNKLCQKVTENFKPIVLNFLLLSFHVLNFCVEFSCYLVIKLLTESVGSELHASYPWSNNK